MRFAVLVSVLAVVVASCTDLPSPTTPGRHLLASISDGAHSSGNPDFFFLPPLVGNPVNDPNFDPGKFNPGLRPVVLVFPLPGGEAVCTGGSVYGPVVAPVDIGGEQYHINWDTKASNLVPGTIYRICVFGSSAGKLLGYLDVEPIAGGMKNARTGDTYLFQDDRTLPIKFRIEFGALCANHVDRADCAEFPTVTSTGGDFTLPSGYAGVSVPPGAIAPGDIVTIVIEKQAPPFSEGTKCLPTDLVQSLGCYHFSTEPALYQFLVDVRMEACVDPQGLDPEALRLYKYNTSQGLVQLPFAAPTLIDCTGFIAMADPAASPPTSFAAAALRGLGHWAGRLLAPPPLYASMPGGVPTGLGGMGGSFSDVGGAVPSSAPQAPVLLTVPENATVGQTGLSATASGGSGTGAYSFASSTAAVCTVDATSGSITLLAAGTCNLTATRAADEIYKAATSAEGSITVTAPSAVLVDCPVLRGGGDQLDRGFYVQSFPGTVVDSAEVAFYATAASTQAVTLMVREGAYDGPVIGFDTLDVTVPGTSVPTRAMFQFFPLNRGYPLSGTGRIVAFSLSRMGPVDATTWFYDVGPCNFTSDCVPPAGVNACNVVETEDTSPPLSVFRRNGVYVRVFGH